MVKLDKLVLLFCGWDYEASGGWRDLRGRYHTMAAAKTAATKLRQASSEEWYQIVDLNTNTMLTRSKDTWAAGWKEKPNG